MAEPRAVPVLVLAPVEQLERGVLQIPLDGGVDVGDPQGDVGPSGSRRPIDVVRLADRVRFRHRFTVPTVRCSPAWPDRTKTPSLVRWACPQVGTIGEMRCARGRW